MEEDGWPERALGLRVANKQARHGGPSRHGRRRTDGSNPLARRRAVLEPFRKQRQVLDKRRRTGEHRRVSGQARPLPLLQPWADLVEDETDADAAHEEAVEVLGGVAFKAAQQALVAHGLEALRWGRARSDGGRVKCEGQQAVP